MERIRILEMLILFLLICLVFFGGYILYLEQNKADSINDCNEHWKDELKKLGLEELYGSKTFELTTGMDDTGTIPTD